MTLSETGSVISSVVTPTTRWNGDIMRLAVTLTGWCVAVLIALPGWVYFAGSLMSETGAGLFPCAFICFAGLLTALVVGCATSSIAKCINPKG